MKYINRGCLTEGAQEEAYTVCSSKCPRHRARQCQCLAVSPGPSQRTDAIQDYKEEQYQAYDGDNTVVHQVSSHHDLEMRTAGRTEKASPFCAPLTWEDSCEPHTVQCYCDFSRNVEKLNSSCYTEYPGRSMASSPEKLQESVPENTDQHSPYESTYQLSYGSSADPGRVHRNVITSCYDEDNCTSAERSPDYSSFPGHSQTRQYGSCATDCTGRKRSGRNFSNDSYHESQAASGSLGYEQYSDGRAINPPMQSPVQSQPNYAEAKTGLPIMICEKRTRTVTFEDESGKVRRMRNVVEHCRSKIEWEQVLTHRDCDADISHSDADFGGNNSTDDDDCTCTCRSSSSAGTEITCIESNCDLHDDFCNNEHDSRSQPNCGSLPKCNHCPCMLRTYVSLASICTPNSRSIQ
ncbi:uncharacterized protein LOC117893213 [Drosophila subobscura]|uniref:uncharacterized protein LOC117893213 n=1 Tax=Drosophila subobscura TaxID=7241 RepID=UPI00155AE1EF|nr:uncharacterized protein LOC117893213 [Drosophila subobscura]